MTTEHDPHEAGLGFAVQLQKESFVGRDALVGASDEGTQERLTCLTIDRGQTVLLAMQPVFIDDACVVCAMSAAFGHTVGPPTASAWLASAVVGHKVEVQYFDRRENATVSAEPLVDPEMKKIRS